MKGEGPVPTRLRPEGQARRRRAIVAAEPVARLIHNHQRGRLDHSARLWAYWCCKSDIGSAPVEDRRPTSSVPRQFSCSIACDS